MSIEQAHELYLRTFAVVLAGGPAAATVARIDGENEMENSAALAMATLIAKRPNVNDVVPASKADFERRLKKLLSTS